MKKILIFVLAICLALSLMVSCVKDAPNGDGDDIGDNAGDNTGDGSGDNTGDNTGDGNGDNAGDGNGDNTGDNTGDGNGDNTGDNTGDGNGDNTDDGGNDTTPTTPHTYTAFTTDEMQLIVTTVGELIPFIPTDEYYIDEGSDEFGDYLNYYTYGNTQAEFDAYRALFSDYTYAGSDVDDYGDTWYYYEKGDVCVDLSFYSYEGESIIDMYIYLYFEDSGDTGGDDSGNQGGSGTVSGDFTAAEKEMFLDLIGETIPFLRASEYYVEAGSDEYGTYINYYTFGNTKAEFDAYRALFVGYTFTGTEVDDYGDTWYYYEKGDICIDLSFYSYEGEDVVDIYIYLYSEDSGDTGGDDSGNQGGSGTVSGDFTAAEKEMFIDLIGETIPFLTASEYYVETGSDEYGDYINYYTYGNTKAEFDAYRALFVGYTFTGTDVDDYGDTWYYYEKGDICIDLSFYSYEGEDVVDIYIYLYSEDSGDTGGGEGNGGGSGDSTLITNDGKGLPTDEDGVFDVDFTTATNVKDVTDQGYYLDGCPTVGTPKVLVIPVDFSDVTAASKGYDIEKLIAAFSSNDATDGFYSVYEYYYTSSCGKLGVDFTVLDEWFRPSRNSSYYASATDAEGYAIGDQLIMDEALAYLEGIMDLSVFDSDGNTVIDAVVMIHTLDIDADTDFYWAYRYWNYYTDQDGYFYEYDGVSANDYLWASFDFLHESYDAFGNASYNDHELMNTYTFIHEFGHVLGADDYYDTEGEESPMGGCDVMDGMLGDHNAFTKFNYGWITSSRLVVADGEITLTLEDFGKTGDTIIIANNWDEELGAYQEYYVLAYYKGTGLNAVEGGYFERDGVVVYHVNASLYTETYEGEVYYDIYNNNTTGGQYSTENNLIEYVLSENGTYTYVEGDTMGAVTNDAGNALTYNFVVDELTDDAATITFTKA